MPRLFPTIIAGLLAVTLAFAGLAAFGHRDPGTVMFSHAQNFEAQGQTGLAIKQYLIIADIPNSFYAPRALMRAADLTASSAHDTNNLDKFKQARDLYARVAEAYPQDPLAVEALMNAADICAESLNDRKSARDYYNTILSKFAEPDSDLAATATLHIGQLALEDGDAKTALSLLRPVASNAQLRTQPPQAQYLLGMVYETLLKDKASARQAYEAVLSKFPESTWANDARERIGLMFFSASRDSIPPRRVMLAVDALPGNGPGDGDLWETLRCLLAARGLNPDETTLRGWSLQPFLAEYDPDNPGRNVSSDSDDFDAVIGTAGLHYTLINSTDEVSAVRNLQDTIDAARTPLVFIQVGDEKSWTLAVGYDSSRNEVLLQNQGPQFQTVPVKAFLSQWKVASSFAKKFTLLAFDVSGQKAPAPSLTPTPVPTGAPALDGPPSFTWSLPTLASKTIHRRAVRRAAGLLAQTRDGKLLANADALAELGASLNALGTRSTPLPQPAPSPAASDGEPTPTPEEVSPYEPTPEPGSDPKLAARQLARARNYLGFFDAPVRQWIAQRRDAAAYLDEAARSLGDSHLKDAAAALRLSASQLSTAAATAPKPADLGTELTPDDQRALKAVAAAVLAAAEAERRATGILSQ